MNQKDAEGDVTVLLPVQHRDFTEETPKNYENPQSR